jgi:hypothetical protein
MLNESAIIGLVLLIAMSAACLYLYSHISYLTKKVGFLESVSVDMRMAIDTLMTEELSGAGSVAAVEGRAAPVVGGSAAAAAAEASLPAADDTHFYSNVLEQAHEEAVDASLNAPASLNASAQPGAESIDAALESFTDEFNVDTTLQAGLGGSILTRDEVAPASLEEDGAALLESIGAPVAAAAAAPLKPNYDAMTRAELTSLAETRGLRVKKSMPRGEIVSLLRRSEPKDIQPQATGVVAATADVDAGLAETVGDDAIPLAAE